MKKIGLFLLVLTGFFVSAQQADTLFGGIIIQPIQHATMVITANGRTIYVDPTGGADAFKGIKPPDMILITDIHGDHFDAKTLAAISKLNTITIVPKAVADLMPGVSNLHILNNGERTFQGGCLVKAIPMYNLPQSDTAKHVKGRGNGYVLTINGKNIYISGDTDGIPEMKELKDIDVAFVCMNPPYTMDITEAATAVLAFQPRIVYPYHYRGTNGLSDVRAFKKQVSLGKKNIDVRLLNWYPGMKEETPVPVNKTVVPANKPVAPVTKTPASVNKAAPANKAKKK